MLTISTSTSWFGARTVVAALVVFAALAACAQAQDGCKIECYPNTKVINGKGGAASGKKDTCRWILRTDGKPARLCDHIQCKKVCPGNQVQAASFAEQQETASSNSDNLRFEQQLEGDAPKQQEQQQQQPAAGESMGIMRQLHGSKLAKAPVPGVAGGRLHHQPAQQQQQQQPQRGSSSATQGSRRMAPTLPPAVEYDEKDTPPPISRFLDISPEE